jgi:hypothetical protein
MDGDDWQGRLVVGDAMEENGFPLLAEAFRRDAVRIQGHQSVPPTRKENPRMPDPNDDTMAIDKHNREHTAGEPKCNPASDSGFAPHAGNMTVALDTIQQTPLPVLQQRRQALVSELAILDAVISARTPKAPRKTRTPKAPRKTRTPKVEAAPSEPKKRGRQRSEASANDVAAVVE